ncbi:MAG: acyltransferase [Muribaculaceae bacterium]|nr:acyltransferase [Muribaculaceae bacterium]
MNTSNTPTKRLEYIDAMRGFTMLLVVYSHIMYFGYGISDFSEINSFNAFIGLFRMPLFFFVSGFVLYKATQIWNLKNSVAFIAKKFKVQIIATTIFFILFSLIFNKPIIEGILSGAKYGYWFTITLFFFYIIYISTKQITKLIKSSNTIIEDSILIITALIIRLICSSSIAEKIGIPNNIYQLFGLNNLSLYIFFIFGIIIKRHFSKFLNLISNKYLTSIIISIFLFTGIFLIKNVTNIPNSIINFIMIVTGITGIVTVFSFFYKYQDSFTKETKVGRVLQYIGKRTLDIYLLHYFFLPRNLQMVGEWFTENINPTLEFFVSLTLAAMVIALCLVVSNVIRISPFLANWLFGVKSK